MNLTSRFGDLDLAFRPLAVAGYSELMENATSIDLDGLLVAVASLADVIRSKEAAGREKDRLVLPTLRRLAERLERAEDDV